MAHVTRLPEMVPSAYLRLYQPLEAFPAVEQAHWERYLVGAARSSIVRPRYRDHAFTGKLGVISPADGEHAEFRVIEGHTFVSPWRLRLRVLAAMLAFAEEQPFELSEQFVPRREARRAARVLSKMRRRDPGSLSFVHQSPWHVPIRWFVLFSDDERRILDDEYGRQRLRY